MAFRITQTHLGTDEHLVQALPCCDPCGQVSRPAPVRQVSV